MASTVLITGATGFIGFHVLLEALKEGYTVRAAVRSKSAFDEILFNPQIKRVSPQEKLSFVVVPDITEYGAYDKALEDVDFVIHVASPLPTPTKSPVEVFDATVTGAANILDSARKTPSVKKVVITSSIVANMPYPQPGTDEEVNASSRVPNLQTPIQNVFQAYCAAKIATLNATDQFIKDNNPTFEIINVIPGFVYGRNEKAQNKDQLLSGSNRLLLAMLLGQSFEIPRLGGAAHILDVAKIHVLALKENTGNDAFGVTVPVAYDDNFEIVKKHFPEAVEKGIFKQGHQPTLKVNWNAHRTEEAFGIKFKTYEDMVVDATRQYLELLDQVKV